MLTSIIILTFNKLQYTKLCIESIRKYTRQGSYEIIVVDNNSTDETVEWLKEQRDIKSILNQSNEGFPKGCNQGIEAAAGDNILLLNNDTIVTYHWLDNLVKCLYSAGDIGAVGPVTNNCSNYQSIPVDYKTIDEMHRFALEFNKPEAALWEQRLRLVGFCMLIKKDVVDKIGFLDERFTPGNFEDDDYSLRIRRAGHRIILCKDTFIHHFGSTSFKDNKSEFHKLLQVNQQKFKDKWGYDPIYASFIRKEIINLIEAPVDKEINILEVGCACGATLLKIKNKYTGANLFGVEIDPDMAIDAALVANVQVKSIEEEEWGYPEGFFDYIIFADVLEHLKDPWRIVKTTLKYLKEEGQVLASIPNIMHFSVIRGLLNGFWSYGDSGILDRTHLRFFTLHEIKQMFSNTGYEILECKRTTVAQTEEDRSFVKHLCTLSDQNMAEQYETYQYIVKASQDTFKNDMAAILIKIGEGVDVSQNVSHINEFKIDKVLKGIERLENSVAILNLIAVTNFQKGLFDNVFPYLNRAYELEPGDPGTLYNMGYILYRIGEPDLALKYLNRVLEKDSEVMDLISVIESANI